jgi:hypothetical protein
MAQRGWTKARLYFRILVPVAALAVALPRTQLAQKNGADVTLNSFTGTWRATCQDGNLFAILNLKVSGSDLVGDISLANMSGENGRCAKVIDPPSPQHAMKVTGARLEGTTLSFQGSSNARFEMSLAGARTAKLIFVGTPVEELPWLLTKSAD